MDRQVNVFVSYREPCSELKMDGKHYKGKIYGAQNLADCDRNIAGSDDDRLHGERYSVVQLYFPVRRIKEVANLARSIHILCAYWGFLFIAVHLGLHWNMMLRILEKVFPMKGVAKIPGLLIAVYGGYAFYKRGIVNYLFLKSHFVFFGPQESLGLFLPDYIAMMGLIVFVTYYGDRLLFGDKGIIWHIWRR